MKRNLSNENRAGVYNEAAECWNELLRGNKVSGQYEAPEDLHDIKTLGDIEAVMSAATAFLRWGNALKATVLAIRHDCGMIE